MSINAIKTAVYKNVTSLSKNSEKLNKNRMIPKTRNRMDINFNSMHNNTFNGSKISNMKFLKNKSINNEEKKDKLNINYNFNITNVNENNNINININEIQPKNILENYLNNRNKILKEKKHKKNLLSQIPKITDIPEKQKIDITDYPITQRMQRLDSGCLHLKKSNKDKKENISTNLSSYNYHDNSKGKNNVMKLKKVIKFRDINSIIFHIKNIKSQNIQEINHLPIKLYTTRNKLNFSGDTENISCTNRFPINISKTNSCKKNKKKEIICKKIDINDDDLSPELNFFKIVKILQQNKKDLYSKENQLK